MIAQTEAAPPQKQAWRPQRAAEYKRLRLELGLTNVALARELGISSKSAQRYEGNKQAIPEPVLLLLQMWVRFGIPDE